jgi:hypothetical protein
MSPKELLSKIATPGDAAAAGAGFAAGLPIDYFLLHMGMPPGIVSGYCAVAAYSVKKSADAYLERRRRNREAKQQKLGPQIASAAFHGELEKRFEGLSKYLKEESKPELLDSLEKKYKQWRYQIISDQVFEDSVKQIIEKL